MGKCGTSPVPLFVMANGRRERPLIFLIRPTPSPRCSATGFPEILPPRLHPDSPGDAGGSGWSRAALQGKAGNGKGCDFGYAPAVDSCEGVAGVDACTVAALGAITAFAVPNLGGNLAIPSIFFGSGGCLESPRSTDRPVYFKPASY